MTSFSSEIYFSLKMKLLGAVFLCTGLVNLVQGKVVDNFNECNQFFVAGQPPTFKGKFIPDEREGQIHLICQTQNPDPKAKDYEYFTLYDTGIRIPLYSAYKFHKRPPGQKITRDVAAWKIEPQLDGSQLTYMTQIRYSKIPDNQIDLNQAVYRDYQHSGYDRGHLYPVNHAHDQRASDGTFTLTNAAPQDCDFNKRWYNEVERVVSQKLEKCKQGFMYVVTGVIPNTKNFMNHAVNVPSHFWTAYCCEGHFSGIFIMSEEKTEKASDDPKILKSLGIDPFGGKC